MNADNCKSDAQTVIKKHESRRRSVLAANLAIWAAQPRDFLNRRALFWTIMAMFLAVVASSHDPHQVENVRSMALLLIASHGVLHFGLVGLLTYWGANGLAEARGALHAYRAPGRISNLDLAVARAGFAAAVGIYRLFVPIAAVAAG